MNPLKSRKKSLSRSTADLTKLDRSSSSLNSSNHSVGGSSRRSSKSRKSTRGSLRSSTSSQAPQKRLSVFGNIEERRPRAGSQTQKDAPSEMEVLQQLHPMDMIAVLERRASVQDMEGDARSFFAMMKQGDFSENYADDDEEDD